MAAAVVEQDLRAGIEVRQVADEVGDALRPLVDEAGEHVLHPGTRLGRADTEVSIDAPLDRVEGFRSFDAG
jgi:hypothetical protein